MSFILLLVPLAALGSALASSSSLAALATTGTSAFSRAQRACTAEERWDYGGAIPQAYQKELNAFLAGQMRPARAFAEAFALRRFTSDPEAKALGEYWVSRALLEAKLYHLAFGGMSSIAAQKPTDATSGVQFAALQCLNQIQNEYPTLSLEPRVSSRLPEYAATSEDRQGTLWLAAVHHLQAQMASGAAPAAIEATLALLRGGGAYERFGVGMYSALRSNTRAATIESLRAFLADPALPKPLLRYVDAAHLTLARSLYAVGQYESAEAELKRVRKSSNDLAEALTELSWAFLMDEKYPEAIGTAINLKAGGLRHTFAPEAPMVMAMALNEICQYPQSIGAINIFKSSYEKPYRWLSSWNPETPLYPLAVQFLKRQGEIPDRVASEWVRSPVFISNQTEINLLFSEKTSSKEIGKAGAFEQRKLANELLALVADIRPRIKVSKMRMKAGDALPDKIVADLAVLRDKMIHFRRMQRAAPVWNAILASNNRQVPTLEAKLVARINGELKRRSLQMLTQLEEIAENNQLIEVEIYNGASQDIIWQNAHPDYKKVAQRMKSEAMQVNAAKTWDWGRAPASEETQEIWEDELGSFKANLFDNCSSKDKYLSLRSALPAAPPSSGQRPQE